MGQVLKIHSATVGDSNVSAPPGYLGLSERQIEVDWNAVAQHGPCVMVKARSPAWKSGLRYGDNVTSINDISYADFHAVMPPAGTTFTINAFRQGVGTIRTFGVLKPVTVPRPPAAWKSSPGVLPGRRVEKKERTRFVQRDAARNPNLTDRAVRILNLLFEFDGPKGIIPKHCTSIDEGDHAIRLSQHHRKILSRDGQGRPSVRRQRRLDVAARAYREADGGPRGTTGLGKRAAESPAGDDAVRHGGRATRRRSDPRRSRHPGPVGRVP